LRLLQEGLRVAGREHARHRRRTGVLERGRGGLRHVRLRRLELGVGVVEMHLDLSQPGLRRGKLLAGLVELLTNLVELRRERVDLGLHLGDRRRWGSASTGGENDKPAHRNYSGRESDTAAEPGLAGRKPGTHVRTTLPCHSTYLRVRLGSSAEGY
jgi:hypothetical protein